MMNKFAALGGVILACAVATAAFLWHSVPISHPDCIINEGKQTYYLGSTECMRLLPIVTVSGTLMVGMEESYFLEGKAASPTVEQFHEGDVWADFEGAPPRPVEAALDKGDTRFFRLEAKAHYSKVTGRFGHLGSSKHGMLVTEVISLKEMQ